MRLGIDTISYRNYRLSLPDEFEPTPRLGMGVTILSRSARRAATVVEVSHDGDKLILTVQEDRLASATDGGGRASEDMFQRNPSGTKHRFMKTKAGTWQCVAYDSRDKLWRPRDATSIKLDMREHHDGGAATPSRI